MRIEAPLVVRVVKDVESAVSSDWRRFIETHLLRSRLVLAHIRHVMQGRKAFENTQPCVRELGGRGHAFAHNGDLPDVQDTGLAKGRFRPIGETDSELAFCELLAGLEEPWLRADPSLDERFAVVSTFARRLRELGPANILYCDGEILFIHSDRRRSASKQPPRPPGLHGLERHCAINIEAWTGAGMAVAPHPDEQSVVLVASVPLTHEARHPLQERMLLAISNGQILLGTHAWRG